MQALLCVSKPGAKGIFTIDQIRKVLEDVKAVPSIEQIYFEGGKDGECPACNRPVRSAAAFRPHA